MYEWECGAWKPVHDRRLMIILSTIEIYCTPGKPPKARALYNSIVSHKNCWKIEPRLVKNVNPEKQLTAAIEASWKFGNPANPVHYLRRITMLDQSWFKCYF